MPRTLPRLLTPFRVQRPDTLPAHASAGAARAGASLAAAGGDLPVADAAPACRGDSLLPPCGRPACPPAGCAGSVA